MSGIDYRTTNPLSLIFDCEFQQSVATQINLMSWLKDLYDVQPSCFDLTIKVGTDASQALKRIALLSVIFYQPRRRSTRSYLRGICIVISQFTSFLRIFGSQFSQDEIHEIEGKKGICHAYFLNN